MWAGPLCSHQQSDAPILWGWPDCSLANRPAQSHIPVWHKHPWRSTWSRSSRTGQRHQPTAPGRCAIGVAVPPGFPPPPQHPCAAKPGAGIPAPAAAPAHLAVTLAHPGQQSPGHCPGGRHWVHPHQTRIFAQTPVADSMPVHDQS